MKSSILLKEVIVFYNIIDFTKRIYHFYKIIGFTERIYEHGRNTKEHEGTRRNTNGTRTEHEGTRMEHGLPKRLLFLINLKSHYSLSNHM